MCVTPIKLTAAVLITLAFAQGVGLGEALAQNCSTGTKLSPSQIRSVINGRYACANLSPTEHWNEVHTGTGISSSGQVLDYKKGPGHPTDPSDTVAHPTGTYSVSPAGADTGQVVYNYGAGGTYGYTIRANLGSASPNLGLYSFCTTGGGINIAVNMSSGHC
jgi:DNA-binding transcriptional regulator YdaS (Cro superfamily)